MKQAESPRSSEKEFRLNAKRPEGKTSAFVHRLEKQREKMKFRPALTLQRKVKQIVGGSLKDTGMKPEKILFAEQDAAFYAGFIKKTDYRRPWIL